MATTYYITHRRMDFGVHGGKHIGSVKCSDGTVFSRQDVLNRMRLGVRFQTLAQSGHHALVIPMRCSQCGATYITTEPDAWKDDNLDNLPLF
jgi:hypothetical protein